MNLLETRLHTWRPRPPSAGLERRIFGERTSLMPKMAWFVGWLVPATACALLTVSIFNSGNGISSRLSQEPMAATFLSNQSYLASAPDNLPKGQNDLSFVTFDWTNQSRSTSSIPSFSHGGMN
jgi:hypothetical protein